MFVCSIITQESHCDLDKVESYSSHVYTLKCRNALAFGFIGIIGKILLDFLHKSEHILACSDPLTDSPQLLIDSDHIFFYNKVF